MKAKLSARSTTLAFSLVAALLSLPVVGVAQPGFISTVAGTGTQGFNGDGIPATTAQLAIPGGVFVDAAGNLFIADRANHRVRKVEITTGLISTVAGTGAFGFNGDGIPATTAQLDTPAGVFVDGSGNLFIGDRNNNRIRKVDGTTGFISTVAGTGTPGFNGDGIPANTADLKFPRGVFVDGSGNLFIGDTDNNRVRKVDGTTGLISTVAGTGIAGFNGDGIPSTTAQLNFPYGVFADGSANVFITDAFSHRVRRVDATTGLISTVAGTGTFGFNGDGIPATSAQLAIPLVVFVDGSGNLFVVDQSNHRVRVVDAGTGLISTVAGTGVPGYNGDGILASSAQLNFPSGVFMSGSGLFVVDGLNHRVRMVDLGISVESTVAELIDYIATLGLGAGLENSLVRKLENALANFERGNENAAVNQLHAFINQVEAKRGSDLTDVEADYLIASAQTIIDAINGGTAHLRAAEPAAVPDQYSLEGNYPNPFNPRTTIRFELPESAHVRLVVYNVLGQQVRVLLDAVREAGTHEEVFEASDLPSGTYLYRLETPQGSFVQTMLLAK